MWESWVVGMMCVRGGFDGGARASAELYCFGFAVLLRGWAGGPNGGADGESLKGWADATGQLFSPQTVVSAGIYRLHNFNGQKR